MCLKKMPCFIVPPLQLALPRGLQWLREFGVMVPILDLVSGFMQKDQYA